MGSLLTVAGWLAGLFLLGVTASGVYRAAIARRTDRLACAPTPLMYGCATAVAFTLLGVLPALPGALMAVALAVALAALTGEGWVLAARRGRGRKTALRILRALARDHVGAGPRRAREDLRRLLGKLRRGPESVRTEAGPVPVPPVRDVPPAPPDVPSVRDDPALGAPPAPGDVGAGLMNASVPVPGAWAALTAEVASFEPADDEELMLHLAGEAAGVLTWAEAARARADNLLHGTGLDPAYVAGHLELADEIADLAAAVAMVDRRFHVIYGAIREWVGAGGILPHRAREFFGGADGADAAGSADEAA
jgi:hypothetical protein